MSPFKLLVFFRRFGNRCYLNFQDEISRANCTALKSVFYKKDCCTYSLLLVTNKGLLYLFHCYLRNRMQSPIIKLKKTSGIAQTPGSQEGTFNCFCWCPCRKKFSFLVCYFMEWSLKYFYSYPFCVHMHTASMHRWSFQNICEYARVEMPSTFANPLLSSICDSFYTVSINI
jgi:hypothetical protein